ncbi:MAG: hypothetical protein JNJ54_03110 [Myxococcaceae bacterium]|nr:hypothetical protein [Myxococcaceae bacterium]
MKDTTLLVGGLSGLHDPLCAAALQGLGRRAVPLHPCTNEGLRRARAFGNHGQCNPAHYTVGAVLEHARKSGLPAAEFAARHAWLTPGSTGPCRLAAFGFEYRRVLEGAGLGALEIHTVSQLAFAGHVTDSVLPPAEADQVLGAVLLGDALTELGHQLRPWVLEPARLDALVLEARDALAHLLSTGRDEAATEGVLATLGARARALPCALDRVLPSIVLVGEPWTTLTDGDPSDGLVRRLEELGAVVECPRAIDWVRHLLFERRADALVDEATAFFAEVDRRVVSRWERLAQAVGVPGRLIPPEELAALSHPHFPASVRGGSGHLELARAVKATLEDRVDLVLSLKPFGCLPSSAVSDGVLAPWLAARRGPAFLAIETTGAAAANLDSRIDMAVFNASVRAAARFDAACAAVSSRPDDVRARLARLPLGALGDGSDARPATLLARAGVRSG